MERLPEFTRQHCIMVAPGFFLLLLLAAGGGPALPGGPFRLGAPLRLGVPHQDRVETPLPEVHPPRDCRPDISDPTEAQRIRKNDVGKDEGSL